MKSFCKKNIFIFLSVIVLSVFYSVKAFAQGSTLEVDFDSITQIMVPKEIFIGDTGQLQYSFRTPADFFELSDPSKIHGDELELFLTEEDILAEKKSCSVTRAVLVRNGLNYNLCITIIPWKTGKIDFKEFDLVSICLGEVSDENKFFIKLFPITIPSLSEKLGVTNIRAPANPLTLPGTKYILWFVIFLAICLMIFLAWVIIRLQKIIRKIRYIKNQIGYYRNARIVKSKLSRLLKKDIDDKTFAMNWQSIMRTYLEYRFSASFAAITGNRIVQYIQKQTGEVAGVAEFDALEELAALFIRTDYIRFADGSIDSQLLPVEAHQAVFLEDEKKSIIERTATVIHIFEHGDMSLVNTR